MPAIAMALRKQRIYTRYKPEPAKTPQRRSDWKALLLLLFVVMGVAWWAAVQGKLVLPSALQQFVQVARQPAADPKTEIEAPAPKPISGFDFGTLPVPPPPLNTTLPAPLPPPAAVEEVPIPPSFEIEQPAPPAKSAYEAVTDPDASDKSGPAEPFRPRSAWTTFEVQVALARQVISPGILDGLAGPQTTAAIKAFQKREGLEPTGQPDARTKSLLLLNLQPFTSYVVKSNDFAVLRKTGRTWVAKSDQDLLGYETILEMVAEKSHSYTRFIEQLNPKVNWRQVAAGTRVKVPLVQYPEPSEKAAFIRISLTNRVLQAFGASSNLLAHFPCSIGAKVEKRPVGELKVLNIADAPNYTFDPEIFPESEEARRLGTKLTINPGPNNPVGTAWIGLDKPGYGIHGTPLPEKIGRTESHGCFRLANWDATHLLKLVTKEMPVHVEP